MRWANELNGTVEVLMLGEDGDEKRVGNGKKIPKALLNPAVTDITFTGKPVGCDQPYCDYMETLFEWRRQQSANGKDAGNHKYLVDVRCVISFQASIADLLNF